MKGLRRGLGALAILIMCLQNAWCGPLSYPPNFESWVQGRVGPVFYPTEKDSVHNWGELTDLASELGTHAVKTWIGTLQPGEAYAAIQTEPYREIIRRFPIVHINLSQAYVAYDMHPPDKINPRRLAQIRKEWHDITLFLCRESRIPGQIFLLSVAGELNVYLGSAHSKKPMFPIAPFVNACHAGKEDALAEWGKADHPRIYSVAEIQFEVEFQDFVAKWVPQFKTDLVSLSYYSYVKDMHWYLEYLRRYVKPLGPFGKDRLMMGEFGPNMEDCNWNQAQHARWHNEILRQAYAEHMQFAFFYLLADEPFVINTSGHHGLVGWSPDSFRIYRSAWYYYQRLYKEGKTSLPDMNLYEITDLAPPVESDTLPNLVVSDLKGPKEPCQAGQKLAFTALVTNTGKVNSGGTTLNFYVDDRFIGWSFVPVLKPGEKIERNSAGDPLYFWDGREGTHRINAVVDMRQQLHESSRTDNSQQIWIKVAPAPPSR